MAEIPDLLWIARYDYEAEWVLEPHDHDFYQIIYILEGIGSAKIFDEEFEIQADSFLFIAPGVTHGLKAICSSGIKTLDTKFRIDVNDDFVESLDYLPFLIVDSGHRVRQLLEEIRLEGMKKSHQYRDMCNALFLQVLIILCRMNNDQPIEQIISIDENQLHDDVVMKAVEWMRQHYSENIGVTEVSNKIGYSSEYLSRKFRKHIGFSPHQYLMKLRIDEAKELLIKHEIAIKEIAYQVGFKSIHHFSRIFKEYTGQPPGSWRNRESISIWKNIAINPEFVNKDITVTPDGISPPDM